MKLVQKKDHRGNLGKKNGCIVTSLCLCNDATNCNYSFQDTKTVWRLIFDGKVRWNALFSKFSAHRQDVQFDADAQLGSVLSSRSGTGPGFGLQNASGTSEVSRNELFRQFRHQERPFTSTISHRRYSRRPTLWRRAKPTSSEWLSFDETSRNSNLFTAIWKICRIVSMELCVC